MLVKCNASAGRSIPAHERRDRVNLAPGETVPVADAQWEAAKERRVVCAWIDCGDLVEAGPGEPADDDGSEAAARAEAVYDAVAGLSEEGATKPPKVGDVRAVMDDETVMADEVKVAFKEVLEAEAEGQDEE